MILLTNICSPERLVRGGEVVEPARLTHEKTAVRAHAREDALVYLSASFPCNIKNPHQPNTNNCRSWSKMFYLECRDLQEARAAIRGKL